VREAKDALHLRYASGEISREDYLQGKAELADRPGGNAAREAGYKPDLPDTGSNVILARRTRHRGCVIPQRPFPFQVSVMTPGTGGPHVDQPRRPQLIITSAMPARGARLPPKLLP
jgi:hypothetical protein